jgi:protein-S-isoprenylcysteine O-methyltransferase Ste14
MKIISVSGYVMMVTGLVGLVLTKSIFYNYPIIIGIQASAFVLMIWARKTFGRRSFHLTANPTKGGLVTGGPYRFIRHPIYAAVILFSLPSVIVYFNIQTIVFVVAISCGSLLRIFMEEKMLLLKYPKYKDYSGKTKRIIPFVY